MEAYSLGLIHGFVGTVALSGAILAIAQGRRHRCLLCGCKTEKTTRILQLRTTPHTPSGTKPCRIVVFRQCKTHHHHVTVEVKDKFLTREALDKKPKTDFDWGGEIIVGLRKSAGLDNVFAEPFKASVSDHIAAAA
ncbi:MAG: hypothetical protein V4697_00730 [Patescibacteria group bacterium]